MSKTLSLHHIVFATRGRKRVLDIQQTEPFHRFIWSIIKDKKCHLLRINSMPEHVHILVDINPSIALSDLVRTIKSNSSQWIKRSGIFPKFDSWCDGYYAASKSSVHKDTVIEYIKNQQIHHVHVDFNIEMQDFYAKDGLTWHSEDLN